MAVVTNSGSNTDPSGFDVYEKNTSTERDIVDELVKDFQQLKNDRGILNNHLTEIAERILPDDKFLFYDQISDFNKGDKRNQELYDSTGLVALERFSAIVDSLLTPRNSFWHQLRPSDKTLQKNKQVRDYFQDVNEILFEERYAPKANFSSQNQRQFVSLGAYGTGAMYIDDLYGTPGLRYKNCHLSEIYLQQNHQENVDRVCRYFTLTAREAIKLFGDALPKEIIEQEKTNSDKRYQFLHWVVPREDRDPFRKDFKGMPWASYYISYNAEKKLLREGGYSSFPYAVSRYRQVTREAYGRSIAMNVLPAIKTLNEQKKTMLKQGHLTVDPIILANDDGVVDLYSGLPGDIIPGGVSKDGRALIQPMPVGRVDIGKDFMKTEADLINDSFLITLFQILVETPEMTATEVLERTREKGILLAPTLGRQQTEYLGPMIERELDILARQGRLPPQPLILQQAQGDYKIIYDSPLTRTQKAEWAAGAMRTVEQLLNVAQVTGNPGLLDYINWDIAAPQLAEINGTPSTWLNTPDVVEAKRQARAQQAQQQQQVEAMPAAAGMMKQLNSSNA